MFRPSLGNEIRSIASWLGCEGSAYFTAGHFIEMVSRRWTKVAMFWAGDGDFHMPIILRAGVYFNFGVIVFVTMFGSELLD